VCRSLGRKTKLVSGKGSCVCPHHLDNNSHADNTEQHMEAGVVVRVIKDFLTTTDGELCVAKGTILQVVELEDRYWVQCTCETALGRLPTAHITPVDNIPALTATQKIYVVVTDFSGGDPGTLQLRRGDLVTTTGATGDDCSSTEDGGTNVLITAGWNQDWLRGSAVDRPGKVGLFPSSCCWQIDASYYQPGEGGCKGRKVEKYAKVVQSMRAQLTDELSLKHGQTVKITHIIDKDWYRGECSGSSGIFPASFVKIIDSFPGDIPGLMADTTPYMKAADAGGHEYSNTTPAYKGLDEGLRSAFGSFQDRDEDQSNLAELCHNARIDQALVQISETLLEKNCAGGNEDTPANWIQDQYFSQNLPSTSFDNNPSSNHSGEIQLHPKLSDPEHQREAYNNLSANLSVLKHKSGPSSVTLLDTGG